MNSVLFITKVAFLDAALEYISEAKYYVDLHVLIEVDPNSCHGTVVDVDQLPAGKTFVQPHELLKETDHEKLRPYISGCRTFNFFIHKSAKSLNWQAFRDSRELKRYVNSIQPDVLHFDDVSVRLLSFMAFMKGRRKSIVNVHDPVQHSGERDWKNLYARKLYYKRARRILTFSRYSQRLFRQEYGSQPECVRIPLKPYNIYKSYSSDSTAVRKYITFIGRLSPYKGIDLFLQTIFRIACKFPDQQFVIAGKPGPGFDMSLLQNKSFSKNLSLHLGHLSATEMSDIVSQSKAVICPYKDATQSGVIMTAYALDTPVVVTNVGGLPEYVQEGLTGYVVERDVTALVDACEQFAADTTTGYRLTKNIHSYGKWEFAIGKDKIMEIYS